MTSTDLPPLTTVVAAVIPDAEGRILIARRPPGVHMAGLWEFPGGKLRPDEEVEEALMRELEEELGIRCAVGRPLSFALHREAGTRILLLFFAARILAGQPHPRERQELAWVSPEELPSFPSPPADAALIHDLAGRRYTLEP